MNNTYFFFYHPGLISGRDRVSLSILASYPTLLKCINRVANNRKQKTTYSQVLLQDFAGETGQFGPVDRIVREHLRVLSQGQVVLQPWRHFVACPLIVWDAGGFCWFCEIAYELRQTHVRNSIKKSSIDHISGDVRIKVQNSDEPLTLTRSLIARGSEYVFLFRRNNIYQRTRHKYRIRMKRRKRNDVVECETWQFFAIISKIGSQNKRIYVYEAFGSSVLIFQFSDPGLMPVFWIIFQILVCL